ncbi:hypothetical protein QBC34DRAFT_498984 [Podospora aff. communis PSN243]|uniref:DUF7580 domain-containing protein n=1 Tax=Podospora aff. communis PSN243 TaxID=3040156 RepID=A0AAV9G8S0_9PEZI|nr:hypothetical protein QBC34DRAFT_498984 [Podospora aff. communis PSN243]
MDPVSIALGVAPLCVAALKGVSKLKEKFRHLRSIGADVKRYRRRLDIQRTIFLGECQLLLREAGLGTTLADKMFHNLDHEHWTSNALDVTLRLHLGERYAAIRDSSEDIGNEIEELDQALRELEVEYSGYDRLAAKVHKARRASRMERNREPLSDGIEDLQRSIAEFGSLRKLAKKLREPSKDALLFPNDIPPTRKAIQKACLGQFALVAQHASSFLQLLSESWTCLKSTAHSKHTIKLLLDAVVSVSDSSVTLRIVLNYEALEGALKHHSLLSLRIQSQNLSRNNTGLPTPESSPHQHLCESQSTAERPAKGRRVRFADSPHQASKREQPLKEPKSTGMSIQHLQGACIGHLANDCLAHHLMTGHDRDSIAIQTQPASVSSLASLVSPTKKLEVSVPDRLHLALRLARSVLQYHSTPCWRPNWNLSDVSYFDIDSDLSASLKTLHIDTNLVPKTDMLAMQSVLSEMPTPPGDDEAQLQSGIRNPTIYSLGAALLQIGRWERFDTDNVVLIRKTARLESRLGPKYAALVAKCVWCDFGVGDDLNDSRLQTTIYEMVVCELEQLIEVLEGKENGCKFGGDIGVDSDALMPGPL